MFRMSHQGLAEAAAAPEESEHPSKSHGAAVPGGRRILRTWTLSGHCTPVHRVCGSAAQVVLLWDSAQGPAPKPQRTNRTNSKARGSQRILQWFLYPQPIYETQPWPEAFSTDDTMSADLAAFKIISLEKDDFGVGNYINNLKIIWLLSNSRFKKKIKQGKRTNTPCTDERTFKRNANNSCICLCLIFNFS